MNFLTQDDLNRSVFISCFDTIRSIIYSLLILMFFGSDPYQKILDSHLTGSSKSTGYSIFIFPDVKLILKGIKKKYILWEPVFRFIFGSEQHTRGLNS